MAGSKMLKLLKGYTKTGEDIGGKKFYADAITGSASRAKITKISSFIGKFFNKLSRMVSYTSMRTYGSLFIVFGGLSLVLQLVSAYFGASGELQIYSIIISSVFLLSGIPFLIFDKPISIALQNFSVTDFIFFEFFCIRRMHRNDKQRGFHFAVGISIGCVLAAIGFFVPIHYIVLAMFTCLYVFLTFSSPEFSFFSIFIAIPYLAIDRSGVLIASMVAITIISYARKVYLGKRVYFFEQYDLVLLIMLACILISGIFVKGVDSFLSSVVMILLAAGYVMASSLVTNRRLADCLINAVIISAFPIALLALAEGAAEIYLVGLADFAGVSATFDKPYTLAMFLIAAGAFSLYFADVRRNKLAKAFYSTVFITNFAALLVTKSPWALITAIIGTLVYAVSKFKSGSGILMTLMAVLPNTLLFIPKSYLAAVTGNPIVKALGFSELIDRWHTVYKMLGNNLLLGVGIGEESFTEEMAKYAEQFSFTDSGNFFLQIFCEAGVFSLIAFLVILLIRVIHRNIYVPYVKGSQVSKLSRFTSVCTVCLLVYGVFNYIWADMTMYYLFWCIFGLGSAALRVSKQEFDDRVAYFSDGRTEDSSSIDITIK